MLFFLGTPINDVIIVNTTRKTMDEANNNCFLILQDRLILRQHIRLRTLILGSMGILIELFLARFSAYINSIFKDFL